MASHSDLIHNMTTNDRRCFALSNRCPRMLALLAADANPDVATGALANPVCPTRVAFKALRSRSAHVRAVALSHPNMHVAIIGHSLCTDKAEEVKDMAIALLCERGVSPASPALQAFRPTAPVAILTAALGNRNPQSENLQLIRSYQSTFDGGNPGSIAPCA